MSTPPARVARPRSLAALGVVFVVLVTGCARSGSSGSPSPAPSQAPLGSAAVGRPSADAGDIVWLCRPGLANNPCTSNLTTTVVEPDGSTQSEPAAPAADPPIDCFYVYPTVSRQPTTNANLDVDPAEVSVAIAQAARFSQVCRVYAPIYPQLTLAAIERPGASTVAGALVAYAGLDAAFRAYLASDNEGRGIVFIGHSQGAALLIALLRREVDPNPSVRRLLVSAVLLGGNVTVPIGATVGGDFAHIPACTSTSETGCVIAYSSFATPPPPNARFGRVGAGLNNLFALKGSSGTGLQVLCVNPAAPAGGTGALEPYLPTGGSLAIDGESASPIRGVTTPFVAYPGEYTAQCRTSGGATWLQVDRTPSGPGPKLSLAEVLGPTWGLHLVDVNVALGNLVSLVRDEAAAYGRR